MLRPLLLRVLAGLLALPALGFAQVVLPPTVDDVSFGPLQSGTVYVTTGGVTVGSGTTLTVEPGAIVKFGTNHELFVLGTLDVQAGAQRTVFTSIADDTVGGDTGGDGPTTGLPGDWRGLRFNANADASELRSCDVRFAGGGGATGAISLSGTDLLMDDVTVESSGSDGLSASGQVSRPTVTNCRFLDSAAWPIDATLPSVPGFSGNTESGSGAGNAVRVVSVPVSAAEPIAITTDQLLNDTLVVQLGLEVQSGAMLTFGPGVIAKFDESSDRFEVFGTLDAQGTSSQPVVFTSIDDDAFGGDTRNDGPTAGSPGDWNGFFFSGQSDASVLRSARVRFAGANQSAAIRLNGSDILMDDVDVELSVSDGIDPDAGNLSRPQIVNCRFTDNLEFPIDDADPVMLQNFSGNSASGNGRGDVIRLNNGVVNQPVAIDVDNLLGDALATRVNLSVEFGSSLTVGAGVVIKFDPGTSLSVFGTLDVQGSASNRVVLTSRDDDAFGGDTFNDGATSGTPGDWVGLFFNSAADASALRSTRVRFAGGGVGAAIRLNGANISLDDVDVELSASNGLDASQSQGSLPQITGSRFTNNAGRSIDRLPIAALAGLSANAASGNGAGDALQVTSATVSAPLAIDTDQLIGDTVVIQPGLTVTVAFGATLTVGPGVIFKLQGSGVSVFGTLDAQGVSTQPVVFTSIDDDLFGGDTAKDGPTTGSPGDWTGLFFNSAADASALVSTRVRFAGGGAVGAAIRLNNADILLQDVDVESSASNGLDASQSQGSFPQVTGSRFTNNAGRSIDRLPLAALPGLAGNTATGNGGGDTIRVTSASVSSSFTIDTGQLIEDTVVIQSGLSVMVNFGVTLTVGPGVVFKLQSSGVTVSGTLDVQGDLSAPVVFTSIADDSVGGEAAPDGPTTGVPGEWTGLFFNSAADASVLRSTVVRFAGFAGVAAVRLNGADIRMEDVVVESSQGDAVLASLTQGSLPEIVRCRFDDNGGRPLTGVSWRTLARLVDTTASGNGEGDFTRLDSAAVDVVTRIDVWNTLNSDGVIVADVRTEVPFGSALTLGAGLIVKFTDPNASGFRALGSSVLFFDGRGYAPVVLTAFTDDDFGGDTNGDGTATAPGPGAWRNVEYVTSAGSAQMNHVHARFGGLSSTATVVCKSPSVSLDAVRVDLSVSDGFEIGQNGGGMRNLVAFGNSGDGVVVNATDVSIIHATVAANVGRGVVSEGSHTGSLSASICWFNGVNANDNVVGFGTGTDLDQRVFFTLGSPAHDGVNGNFVVDPLFTDPDNGDLTLSLFSSCVGTAGAPNDAFTFEDHDGNSRVLDHNLFGFALPDRGAYEYAVYSMSIDGQPRLGKSLTLRVEGQPFQGNPPGVALLFVGTSFNGIGLFLPPYGNANIFSPALFKILTSFLTSTDRVIPIPNDPTLVGFPLGLQALVLPLGNPAVGNFANPFYGTIDE